MEIEEIKIDKKEEYKTRYKVGIININGGYRKTKYIVKRMMKEEKIDIMMI